MSLPLFFSFSTGMGEHPALARLLLLPLLRGFSWLALSLELLLESFVTSCLGFVLLLLPSELLLSLLSLLHLPLASLWSFLDDMLVGELNVSLLGECLNELAPF